VRLSVISCGTILDSSGTAIPELQACVEETCQHITVLLDGAWKSLGDIIQPGTTLHVIDGRWARPDQLYCGNQSLVVFEPDLLLDVTMVAECFDGRLNSHLLALWRMLAPYRPTHEALSGTIVNACFDELLVDCDADLSAIIDRALRTRYMDVLAALGSKDFDWESLQTSVTEHATTLRRVIEQLDGHKKTTEPTFIAPIYGIQGRLDVMIEHDQFHRNVIELKSGSPPPVDQQIACSTNARFTVGMRPSHAMQITGYHMLLDAAYPERYGTSEILYSQDKETPLRNAPNAQALKVDFLLMRNRIVAMFRALAQRRFGALTQLATLSVDDLPHYRDSLTKWRQAMAQLTEQESLYVRTIVCFAFSEWIAQLVGNPLRNGGYANLWRKSIPEKTEQLEALTYLRVNRAESQFDRGYITLDFTEQTPNISPFRVGDIVVLYPHDALSQPGMIRGQVFKCSIRQLDAGKIVVSLRNKLFDRQQFETDRYWALDGDVLFTGIETMVRAVTDFVQLPSDRRQMLLGLVPPRSQPLVEVPRPERLTDTQYAIYRKALSAQDYFLLEGPPGTGKTRTMLRTIVEHLLESPDETILCAALTNRAVDEICSALEDLAAGGTLFRMGTLESTEHKELAFAAKATSDEHTFEELQTMFARARIIVATVPYLNANPALLTLKKVTTAIIDEAAQLLEPHVLGIISKVQRCILIGDACQLPAVVQQDERSTQVSNHLLDEIELRQLDMSLFERLLRIAKRNGWNHAWGRLTEQGRMHQVIAQFPSTRFYGTEFGTLHPWQRSDAPRLGHEQLPEFLRHRLVFINCHPEPHFGYNHKEASIASACAAALLRSSHALRASVGIIAPFRKQIRTIVQQLDTRLDAPLRAQISVDTVERFQGSERDHIIISCAVNTPSDLQLMTSPVQLDGRTIDRKLNVALTRARHQVVVIGSSAVLKQRDVYQDLIAHIERNGVVLSASQALESIESVMFAQTNGASHADYWH
jgi:DNA replication ATP-dependent helicase Dna2